MESRNLCQSQAGDESEEGCRSCESSKSNKACFNPNDRFINKVEHELPQGQFAQVIIHDRTCVVSLIPHLGEIPCHVIAVVQPRLVSLCLSLCWLSTPGCSSDPNSRLRGVKGPIAPGKEIASIKCWSFERGRQP